MLRKIERIDAIVSKIDGYIAPGGSKVQQLRTFFPRDWEPQRTIDAITEAYLYRVQVAGRTFEGRVESGMHIILVLDDNDQIMTAYPRRAR